MSHGFLTSAASVVAGAFFTFLLVIACITDALTRRIPNELVLLLVVGGLARALVREPGAASLVPAVEAMGLGFVIWIPFHLLRMLGAGDVKLFAAASAWLAPMAVVNAALLAALVGGVLSLVWMLRSYGGAFTLFKVSQMASVSGARAQMAATRARSAGLGGTSGRTRLPYGIAMAIGLLVTAWLPYHLL